MPIGPLEQKKDAVIRLTPTQCARLTDIAEKLHCVSGSGPTSGQPSWRVMVAGIADGVLLVRNPADKAVRREKKRKKREKITIPGAPAWWRPWYGNAMGLDYAVKASGLAADALGLRIERNDFLTHPDVVIGQPDWPAPFVAARPHWWWFPEDDGGMAVRVAVEASGLSLDQMLAGGMRHESSRIFPGDGWKGWGEGTVGGRGNDSGHPTAVSDSD